ncbi:AAA family ATPase [Burkholderia pseudomallei]|uniref:AAA family ATPase n=1 Tax=Burkholderia pseudomallei TaxID=28450 RepID=UPI000F08B6CC|nr:AAA family ATPase [Burkholderia pseudomallei]
MARMIPSDGPSLTGSNAEHDLYPVLKEKLSDDFVVIHGVPWLTDVASRRSSTGKPTGEIDFLILHPEYGVLAIEVKGGGHRIQDHHYVHVASGRRVPVIKQARDNAHGFARWFDPSLGMAGRIGYAIALPDSSLDRTTLPPALRGGHAGRSDDIVLLMDDLERVGERIRQIMIDWRIRLDKGPLGQAMLDQIVALVSPQDDGESIWQARIYGRDERWLKLTDQQIDCLDHIGGSTRQVVLGWPGTGKTLLAGETAKRAAQRGQRCLFLTFNKRIAAHLRTLLEEIESCDVFHFHGMLKEMPGAPAGAPEAQNEEAILRQAVRDGFFARWDMLIVDEAQALDESWHQALADAFKGKPVYAFCDDAQRFGFEKGVSSTQLCQMYQAPPAFQLTYCLRNPYQIHAVLRQLMPPPFQLVCPRSRDLTSLEEIVAKDLREELERQLDTLLTRGLAPEDIVVLDAYGCPRAVYDVLLMERFAGIESWNVAAFRGMESRAVVFVVDGGLDSDLPVFSAYSRTTSYCVAIYGYRVLRDALDRPDRARSRQVLSVATRNAETVRAFSDAMIDAYRLGVVDGAIKLAISTADVYWHPVLRCWLVGRREGEPAGFFWEHQLLQYEWPVIVLNRTEQAPYVCAGHQSLDRNTGMSSSLSIAECEPCEMETYHDDRSGCLSCATYDVREVPASLVDQLETYDRQIVEIVTKRLKPESARSLPISMVAMGMARLVAAKYGAYSTRLLVDSGTLGYNAASTILCAYVLLSGCDDVNRKAFADRFFPYAEASPASPTFKQWWSVVALAFDVAVRQGMLTKTADKESFEVSPQMQAERMPARGLPGSELP